MVGQLWDIDTMVGYSLSEVGKDGRLTLLVDERSLGTTIGF